MTKGVKKDKDKTVDKSKPSPTKEKKKIKGEETTRTEEKTDGGAIAKPKAAAGAAKKVPSKASVSTEKKKPAEKQPAGIKKTKSTVSIDKEKTIDEEKKTKKKEKWPGDEAANAFTSKLATVNMQGEYDELQKIPAQLERCKIWQSNSSRNRHPDYKCYDDSRLIVQLCKNDYINGTKINVPNFSPMIYLVQLPKLEIVDAVEEFWRMVFQDQCQSVHIIARPDELSNPGIEKLFAQESGAYLYANGFFINTRKVERETKKEQKPDMFVVELLPEGCSNSVMCSVYLHTYWKPFLGPERFHAQIRAAQQIAKNDGGSNSPTVICSVRGAGRNASLLALAVAVDQLVKGKEPKIREIVQAIREQRPMSVDSWPQYLSIYLATSWFIKAKVSSPTAEEVIPRIKKFNEKAHQYLPNSVMKQPTEEC